MSDTITYDVVADLVTRLTCDWTACPVPTVELIWDRKATGFVGSKQEVVLVQPLRESISSFQLHGDSWIHELLVKIDVRTYKTLAIQNTIVKETGRILKNILRRAGASPVAFIDAHLRGFESLDEQYRNLFRGVFTIAYRDVTPFTFT